MIPASRTLPRGDANREETGSTARAIDQEWLHCLQPYPIDCPVLTLRGDRRAFRPRGVRDTPRNHGYAFVVSAERLAEPHRKLQQYMGLNQRGMAAK